MSDQAPAMTVTDALWAQGKQVTVTLPDGKQTQGFVTDSRVDFNRIEVTTEKHWVETQEREYIDGLKVAVLTIEINL